MNKNFKFYAVIWAVMLVAYNAIVFLVRSALPGGEAAFDARFWIAWAVTLAAFACNLACARIALKQENLEKVFYRVPLIRVSYLCLLAMIVAGVVLMLVSGCPAWVSAVACVVILAVQVASVVQSEWAAQAVEQTDREVRAKASLIRALTARSEGLSAYAKSNAAKEACEKVHEALRYSDPMSSDLLADIEEEMQRAFTAFSGDIKSGAGDAECRASAERLLTLIADRNAQCKAVK